MHSDVSTKVKKHFVKHFFQFSLMIWRVVCYAMWNDGTTWPRPNRTPPVFDSPYWIDSNWFAHWIDLNRLFLALLNSSSRRYFCSLRLRSSAKILFHIIYIFVTFFLCVCVCFLVCLSVFVSWAMLPDLNKGIKNETNNIWVLNMHSETNAWYQQLKINEMNTLKQSDSLKSQVSPLVG